MSTKNYIEALVNLAESIGLQVSLCGTKSDVVNVVDGLDDVGYSPGHIYFLRSAFPPWLAHEIAHWLVATPEERQHPNYGFGLGIFQSLGAEIARESEATHVTHGLWRVVYPNERKLLKQLGEELSLEGDSHTLGTYTRKARLLIEAHRQR